MTERLKLRLHCCEDIADFLRCFSDPEVVRFEPYLPMNAEEAQKALNSRIGNADFIAIERKADGRYIGNVFMGPAGEGVVELGYALSRDCWHSGYATEACRALIDEAFAAGVHRIIAECDPQNTASWKLLERLGFVREAHLRQNVFFWKDAQGRPLWKDTYQYALLNPADALHVTVREAALDELPRIADMKRQIHEVHAKGRPDLFQPVVERESFEEHAASSGLRLLLAELGGDAVGYVLIHVIDRPANAGMKQCRALHVEEFCVDERHRHKGIGRALMDAVRQAAKTEGLPRIELDVWAFNEGAKQFYEEVGLHAFRYFMEMEP